MSEVQIQRSEGVDGVQTSSRCAGGAAGCADKRRPDFLFQFPTFAAAAAVLSSFSKAFVSAAGPEQQLQTANQTKPAAPKRKGSRRRKEGGKDAAKEATRAAGGSGTSSAWKNGEIQ